MKVHSWEIKGRYKVNKILRNMVRERIRENYGSLRKWQKIYKLSDYHHRKLHKKFTRSDILFKIIDSVNIPRHMAEKYINEVLLWNEMYLKIKFPYELNPFHIRIASHVIGDGSCYKTDKFVGFCWGQKDVEPLKLLQEDILEIKFRGKRNNRISISKFIMKIVCSALDIDIEKFSKEDFLEKIISLSREFRIQVLTAIIEDESTIENCRIVIRLGDSKLLDIIIKLIDSLDYERSSKSVCIYNTVRYGKYKVYGVAINSLGARKYNKDLVNMRIKYGNLLDLWTKRKGLDNLLTRKVLLSGKKENRNLSNFIINNYTKGDIIKPKSLMNDMGLRSNRIYSVLRYMYKKGHIEKINKGLYKLVK
ncbi:MAG: hypothetical protein KJ906_01485 [Nanoarchaeota archaeon]|nr:hypothetical protein [Nanoarchaeota archaeon]